MNSMLLNGFLKFLFKNGPKGKKGILFLSFLLLTGLIIILVLIGKPSPLEIQKDFVYNSDKQIVDMVKLEKSLIGSPEFPSLMEIENKLNNTNKYELKQRKIGQGFQKQELGGKNIIKFEKPNHSLVMFIDKKIDNDKKSFEKINLISKLHVKNKIRKKRAYELARKLNWEPSGGEEEITYELQDIEKDNVLVYGINNAKAAICTGVEGARELYSYLTGEGIHVCVWDAGVARNTHQELIGRVNTPETSTYVAHHPTRIVGTMISRGIVASTKGMAPGATATSLDWNNDKVEMAAMGMSYPGETNTVQISNHSYGFLAGWSYSYRPPHWFGRYDEKEPYFFGQYDLNTAEWDEICHAAPYLLPFKSAGNDRDENHPVEGVEFEYWKNGQWNKKSFDPATDPLGDGDYSDGFDTVPQIGTAKNVMTVGSVKDGVRDGKRYLKWAYMSSFSAWGPTDDGRLKPDIVANGWGVVSTDKRSDTSSSSSTGTSLSSANASGSAILILQHFKNLFPEFYLRSSSLKALIIHNVDDMGNPGPDYKYGWGLMNIKKCIRFIDSLIEKPKAPQLIENHITGQDSVIQHPFAWDGKNPIRVTLCWTDVKGAPCSGKLDEATLKLVNDLDVRVVSPSGSVYYPYVLNPSNPNAQASTGRNFRDNVEQVYISRPQNEGKYIIEISGKLKSSRQVYSLIITGSMESDEEEGDGSGETQLTNKDEDEDGMADKWEINFWGNTEANKDDDDDGDKVSNLDEFIAGTHPLDAEDSFMLVNKIIMESGEPKMQLMWPYAEGRKYTIKKSSAFPGANESSVVMYTDQTIEIVDGWAIWVDNNISSETGAGSFYKVDVEIIETDTE